MQRPTTSLAIDWRLLFRLRALGFAFGLAASLAFPLALSPLLSVTDASCLAHWAYPVGEFLAFVGSMTIYGREHRSTLLAHGLVTAAWATFVGWNCHLWIAISTGALVSLRHVA